MKRVFVLTIYIKFLASVIVYFLKVKFLQFRFKYLLWKMNRLHKKFETSFFVELP